MPYAQVLEENGPAGAKVYAYGNDMLNMQGPEGTRWFAYDGLGSTRALTDSTGTLTDAYTYEAFGTVVHRTGASANEFQFTGEQYEAALDMYYSRARCYDPCTGRFAQQDTYEGDPQIPVSLQRYLYCGADPVNAIDPTGLFTISQTVAAIAIQATLNAVTFGSIAFIFGKARGLTTQQAFRSALKAGGIGMLLAIPYVGTAVGLYFLGGFVWAAYKGELTSLDYWEAATCLLAALVLKQISPQIANSLIKNGKSAPGGNVAQSAQVYTKLENGAVFPEGVQGTSPMVGDFTGLQGLDPVEVLRRIPANWIAEPSDTSMGVVFRDPANPMYNSIRIMPGNPNSPYVNSMGPYVKVILNGSHVDNFGVKVPGNSSAAHIPLKR